MSQLENGSIDFHDFFLLLLLKLVNMTQMILKSANNFFFVNLTRILDGLDGPGSIPRQFKIFFFSHSVQTGSGAHPASYPMAIGGDFPGG
jgi:hypothetical protein